MPKEKCNVCNGLGRVPDTSNTIEIENSYMFRSKICTACNGTGFVMIKTQAPPPPPPPTNSKKPPKPPHTQKTKSENASFTDAENKPASKRNSTNLLTAILFFIGGFATGFIITQKMTGSPQASAIVGIIMGILAVALRLYILLVCLVLLIIYLLF